MRRIVLALLALIVAVSMVGGRPLATSAATPYVKLALTSGYVGDYEEYHVTFLLGRDVKPRETLSVVFDDSINRAGPDGIAASDVLIDGIPAGPLTHWSGHTLTISAATNLSAVTTHELTILRGAMVQNPLTPTHVRLLLMDNTTGTTLTSNYCGITNLTQVSPVSLTIETSGTSDTTFLLQFRTGRAGALVWAPAERIKSSSAVASDTISIRLSPALSQIWDANGAPVAWFNIVTPGTGAGRSPRLLHLVSTSDWSTGNPDVCEKEVTYELQTDTDMVDKGVGASTDVLVRLEFGHSGIPVPVTTDDYALVWTSKEPTMVRVSLTGVPDPVPETPPTPVATDTTAPTVTWTSKASTLLPRLVTLDIVISEQDLDEAWFSGGTDSLIHTRLASGDNSIMLVNRTGIHGTIVATDKAGNTTTVPVDIPAPSTT